MKRIGVDVGGTFTDLILVDEDTGRITVDKVPSTPDDPARGVVDGHPPSVRGGRRGPVGGRQLLHGTTVATNIVLTHTGAEVGMLTTEGFRDVLHIARHKKPFNFSLQQELPWQSRPLVKRRHRLTVSERVTAPAGRGADRPRRGARCASGCGRCAPPASRRSRCACCTPTSTPRTSDGSRRSCSRSSRRPICRCPTRCCRSTASSSASRRSCLNAYVGPKVSRYVARFDGAMEEAGFAHGVQLMQSSGGMATVDVAAQRPVNMLMSGPVAGLLGGIWAGQDVRLRGCRDARHRRHLGRHRRRRSRADSHAASARHQDRRLPGDGADG